MSDSKETYNHDEFAWKLADTLLEDLKPFLTESWRSTATSLIGSRTPSALRKLDVGDFENLTIIELKARYQLAKLFSKYSFEEDAMSESEILELSKKKFLDNQERINSLEFPIDDKRFTLISMGAREHIAQILGLFSKFDILREATFGKKSSVGIPMRNACEGARYEAPITGSRDLITWFDKIYSCWNRPAYNYAKERAGGNTMYREIDTLEVVFVDKKWNSKRMIVPNTTLGTLYSSGVGRAIEERLRRAKYDIRTLQGTHGELARFGSITGSLVTADQSLASDNITTKLIDWVLPREWASACKLGRINKMKLDDLLFETNTFSTMGIGFTFPLQTLVFLGILLSIRDFCGLGKDAVVSVYGDDLIYDVRMHNVVTEVFPQFGLVINADKTFSEGYFRESCGQDYYRGVDVRPFMLARKDNRDAKKRRFEAYLYKTVNGLRRRWSDSEIPGTLKLLEELLVLTRGRETYLVVPKDFPDTSGIKAIDWNFSDHTLAQRPRRNMNGVHNFRYLAFEASKREEVRATPYLFLALRASSGVDYLAYKALSKVALNSKTSAHGLILQETPSVLQYGELEEARSSIPVKGKKSRPTKTTFISEQGRGRFRERPGVTSNWTPEV